MKKQDAGWQRVGKASGKLAGRHTGVMVGHRPRVGRGEGERRKRVEEGWGEGDMGKGVWGCRRVRELWK